MNHRRKLKRSSKVRRVNEESLAEIARLAGLISALVREQIDGGANPYAVALALESQVQMYCRMSGYRSPELITTAINVIDDPRLKKTFAVHGEEVSVESERKKVEEKSNGGETP